MRRRHARCLAPLVATLLALRAVAQTPCCQPHPGPGCSDIPCLEQVCLADPWCCSAQWDLRCASEASVLCDACRPTTECQLPPAAVVESEPCGSSLDDPCASPPGNASVLPWNTPVAGTLWSEEETRDVDWYLIELPQPSRVRVECWSRGPAGIAIVDLGCPPTVHAEGPDGCPASIEACLPAGSFRVVVRPLLFEPLACGDARGSYVLQASRESCDPNPPANDRRIDALSVGEGFWAFDSTEASSDPTPLPSWCDEGGGLAISRDVWFLFESPREGLWTIGTCDGSGWDTRLAVYSPSAETPMACSDDACAADAAQLRVPLVAGETVLIRLGGWGHGGEGTLRIGMDGAAGTCPGDLDGTGLIDAADIGLLLLLFGSADSEIDLDVSGTIDAGDLGLLLLRMGPCPGGI